MDKQQDLKETLHEVVERTRVKALHALTGLLATARLNQHVYSLAHWQAQQLQLKIHAITLQHLCRTLTSLASDLAVSDAIFDIYARKQKFLVEKEKSVVFLEKLKNLYLCSIDKPTPLAKETVIQGLSNVVLTYSIKGLGYNRRDQIIKELNSRIFASEKLRRDLLTTSYVVEEEPEQFDAVKWLITDELPAHMREKYPVDTLHSRLMLHP